MLSLSKQATYPWVELVACPEPVEGKPGQAGYAESRLLGFDKLNPGVSIRYATQPALAFRVLHTAVCFLK